MYKLMLSDLDETLLVDHHVPEFNREAIKKAREKGLKFVPCTGRAFNMIPEIIQEIGIDENNQYSICFNGGLIVENKSSKILHFKGLDYDLAHKLFEYGRNLDVCVLVFTIDCCYIYHPDPDEVQRKITQKAPLKVMDEYDLEPLKDDHIAKILFMKRDMDFLMTLKAQMEQEFDDVAFASSSYRYIEMNAKGVDKGYGLKWLAKYLHLKTDEIIAIGDNYNDVPMLKEAGLGCCVSSSLEDIKSVSDYVCTHDYFDGAVKEVIEKFV